MVDFSRQGALQRERILFIKSLLKNTFFLFIEVFILSTSYAGTTPVVPVSASMQEFIISLPANPSTGFSWTVVNYDKKIIRFIKVKYRVNKNSRHLIGAGGMSDFYFSCIPHIKRPKSTDVELKYARSWEKKPGNITKVAVVFTK